MYVAENIFRGKAERAMVDRMGVKALRAEYRVPGMREVLLTYLDMMVGRLRAMEEFKARGAPVNFVDLTVIVYCFIWEGEGGARPQEIVDTLELPRRTIRDILDKLVRSGALVRIDGAYFPTEISAAAANAIFPRWNREMKAMCDSYEGFRNAMTASPVPRE